MLYVEIAECAWNNSLILSVNRLAVIDIVLYFINIMNFYKLDAPTLKFNYSWININRNRDLFIKLSFSAMVGAASCQTGKMIKLTLKIFNAKFPTFDQ